jgi:serine/threonine-protein kinase
VTVIGLLAAVNIAGAVYWLNGGKFDRFASAFSKSTSTSSKPAANAGPLTGVFRAAFGPEFDLDGSAEDDTPVTGTYNMRSVCGGTGCVATADVTEGPAIQPPLVFDQADGGAWVAVSVAPNSMASPGLKKCSQALAPDVFQIFRLEAKPDGTFTGDFTETNANTCSSRRDVTFIRTGDVNLNSVPDPASVAPRVVSPAEGLRGIYKYTLKFSTGEGVGPLDLTVRTDCVRTGDRCSSFFYSTNPKGGIPLVFADGKWTWTMELDATCGQGKTSHVSRHVDFALPAPPQNPIALLTGHGHDTVTGTGECATSADLDVKFERTGD